jgi:hypothetical protein
MNRIRSIVLAVSTALYFSVFAAGAESYLCKESDTVSIDQYGISYPAENESELEQQDWIVDMSRGWRRSDFPFFHGSCQTNKGYAVCKSDGLAYGEATLSIHPNGSNFIVVYMDYGLGALTIVGKCTPN